MTRLAALCVAAVLAGTAVPAHAAERSLSLISTTGSTDPAVWMGASSDGARVWFASDERLVADDTDAATDIYERGQSGALRLVSGGVAGAPATFAASSEDGSRLWFTTTERLLPAVDADGAGDVYEWREDGTLRLVSGGAGLHADTFAGASLDGSRVWFVTRDAVALPDVDLAQDVWERAADGSLRLVSAGLLNADASFAGASADGTRVWFETSEAALVGDIDVAVDIYERRADGALLQVSLGGGAESADFSGATTDGSRVFFVTGASLVPADTDGGVQDIYERTDAGVGLVTGGSAVAQTFRSASADGMRVWYSTTEALVGADTDGVEDVYERRADGSTVLASGGSAALAATFAGTSADGERVWFSTAERLDPADVDAELDVYERGPTGLISALAPGVAGGSAVTFLGARRDGSAVWLATAEALLPVDADGGAVDIYERAAAGELRLISRGAAPLPAQWRGATLDGSRIWFQTAEGLGDSDIAQDVYETSFALPVVTTAPTISGNSNPGFGLTCSDGAWEVEGLRSVGRQWLRDGAAISGASSALYVVTDADIGAQLSCRVTQRNAIGATTAASVPVTVTRLSPQTARVTGATLTPRTFKALRRGPALIRAGGMRLRFTLSTPAAVEIRVEAERIGRRVGGRCVARTRANRNARHCTRWAQVRGNISFRARSGQVVRRLSGRLAGKRLPPGTYRVVVVAKVAGGSASTPLRLRFAIRR